MRIRLALRGLLTVAIGTATVALGAPAAHAAFGVSHFDAATCATNTEPTPECSRDSSDEFFYQQAAGHPPFGITDFTFNTTGGLTQPPDGNVKDVRVDLPLGLSVNPEATPKCTKAQLEASTCTAINQVGVDYLTAVSASSPPVALPVYNIEQPQGSPALFGINAPVAGPTYLVGGVAWDSDYHESFTISDIPTTLPLVGSRLVFNGQAGDGTFITLPSPCEGPQTTDLHVDSHQDPGHYLAYSATTAVGVTGCGSLPFAPTISASSDTHEAGAPAGVTIDVKVPQNPNGKDHPNTATLRNVDVTLPEGMSINPSAATGLEGCTDAQLGQGTKNPVACPEGSEIGTVSIETPVLPAHSLPGKVYLGQPLSTDPASGEEYRMFIDAESPRYGVSVRLTGHVRADPATGQLTASFTDNPQVPVSLVRVALRGGPRATLVNPPACGTYTSSAKMTSWGGQTATDTSDMTVDEGCTGGTVFAPGFAAAPSDTLAGASPNFDLGVTRSDADQRLARIDVSLPPGLLAKTAGIPLCPDDRAAAGTCEDASRIGSTSVTAGAGPSPFGLGGRVYLTGPYDGAPYGLSIVVPAIAGPFDLGTVVVRATVSLDRNDAHVRVLSDPLPTILGGVPLLVRSAGVTIDRADTMRNPTSCAAQQITAALTSTGGLTAAGAAPLTATDCGRLAFSPKTSIALTGAKQTGTDKHPGVEAKVTQAAGQANISQVKVTLPLSLALDPDNAETLCEAAAGAQGSCPEKSVIGTATAKTPLLDHPLSGKVYFVKGVRTDAKTGRQIKTLPTLLVQLRGDVALDLRAASSVDARSRLVTTFAGLPDAAVSSFEMKLTGGKHGILVVTSKAGLCTGRKQNAQTVATGQNTKVQTVTTTLQTPCPKAPRLGKARAVGQRVALTVVPSGAGKIVVSDTAGRLAKVTRKVRKGHKVRVSLRLTRSGAKKLARSGRLSERLSVRYVASNGASITVKSSKVTLKR